MPEAEKSAKEYHVLSQNLNCPGEEPSRVKGRKDSISAGPGTVGTGRDSDITSKPPTG